MLTLDGCRARQQRFRERLEQAGMGGALISAPRDIYYLTGLLAENGIYPFPSVLYLGTDGGSWLATWVEEGDAVVDERLTYDFHVLYTMNPAATARLTPLVESKAGALRGARCRAYQREALPFAVAQAVERAAGPGE